MARSGGKSIILFEEYPGLNIMSASDSMTAWDWHEYRASEKELKARPPKPQMQHSARNAAKKPIQDM